jgi:hypothetical protein
MSMDDINEYMANLSDTTDSSIYTKGLTIHDPLWRKILLNERDPYKRSRLVSDRGWYSFEQTVLLRRKITCEQAYREFYYLTFGPTIFDEILPLGQDFHSSAEEESDAETHHAMQDFTGGLLLPGTPPRAVRAMLEDLSVDSVSYDGDEEDNNEIEDNEDDSSDMETYTSLILLSKSSGDSTVQGQDDETFYDDDDDDETYDQFSLTISSRVDNSTPNLCSITPEIFFSSSADGNQAK